jgi:hypothetical protein
MFKCDTKYVEVGLGEQPPKYVAHPAPGVTVTTVEQPPTLNATLSERGAVYGSYPEQCRISQNIKRAMMDSPNWAALSDDKVKALEIIAVKMGRILNGDPEYADNWHRTISREVRLRM